jgi:hypothetical protein
MQMRQDSMWWLQRIWRTFCRRYVEDSERILNFLPILDENDIIGVSRDALGATLPVHLQFKEPLSPPDLPLTQNDMEPAFCPNVVDHSKENGTCVSAPSDLDHVQSNLPPPFPPDSPNIVEESKTHQRYRMGNLKSGDFTEISSQPASIPTATVTLSDSQLPALNSFELQEIVIEGLSRDDSARARPIHIQPGVDFLKTNVDSIETGTNTILILSDTMVAQNRDNLSPHRTHNHSRVRGINAVGNGVHLFADAVELNLHSLERDSSLDLNTCITSSASQLSEVAVSESLAAVDLPHVHSQLSQSRTLVQARADNSVRSGSAVIEVSSTLIEEVDATRLPPAPSSTKRPAVMAKALETEHFHFPPAPSSLLQKKRSAFLPETESSNYEIEAVMNSRLVAQPMDASAQIDALGPPPPFGEDDLKLAKRREEKAAARAAQQRLMSTTGATASTGDYARLHRSIHAQIDALGPPPPFGEDDLKLAKRREEKAAARAAQQRLMSTARVSSSGELQRHPEKQQ